MYILILNSIFLLITSILLSCVGNFFIRKNFFYNFTFGWLFASLILCITGYFYPNYSREIIFILILFSIFFQLEIQKKYLKNIYFKISNNKKFLIFLIISYIIFIDKSIFFYEFINNNTIHHGMSLELLTADYSGTLKYPHHYPFSIGPYHLLSNSTLASLNIFSIMPNMHLILETKFFIIIFYFSYFIYVNVNKKINLKVIFFSILIYLCFLGEINLNYDFGSMYLFFVLSIVLLLIIFENNYDKSERIALFTCCLIFLINNKATIGYIYIPVLFYIFFKNKFLFRKVYILILLLITFLIHVNIILMPKNNFLKASSEFHFVSPFNNQSIMSFSRFITPFVDGIENKFIDSLNHKYLNSDTYVNLNKLLKKHAKSDGGKVDAELFSEKIFKSSLIIFFILIKFYIILFYLNNKLYKNSFQKEINIILFTSILGWLIVRNQSYYSMNLQSNIYFAISLLSFFYLLKYVLVTKTNKFLILILLIYGVANFYFSNPNYLFNESYYAKSKKYHYLVTADIENCLDKKFDIFKPNNFTILSSIILSKGIKLYCPDFRTVEKLKRFEVFDEYFRHRAKPYLVGKFK